MDTLQRFHCMMDQKVALYLQTDGTDKGSSVLDDSIRIQVF